MSELFKIIRGYYLTGVGQEPLAYYFKLSSDNLKFESISAGDVALTFYQNEESITSIPAIIRVDSVISNDKMISDYLQEQLRDHYPMLPIVRVLDSEEFDPLLFQEVMITFTNLKSEIKELAKIDYVQGSIFDFMDEEEIDCPYCQVGKSVVVEAANKGSYPTFYIDTQTEEGQKLVEKYQVEKAATIIKIRKGKIKKYLYALRDSEEKIVADEKSIQEAIND